MKEGGEMDGKRFRMIVSAVNAMLRELTEINRGLVVTPRYLCALGQPEDLH